MKKKPDRVFISYRRQTSKHPALLVYKDLLQRGYDVFIDYQSIDSGKFAVEILNQIASRSHFVVILSPDCLNRTTSPDDWLRKEIEYAIDMQRNIVPLLFDGFGFENAKQYLTGKLSALGDYNGLTIPDGYFDEAMKKLRDRFLKQPAKGVVRPAPKSDNTFVQKALQKADNAAEQETNVDVFLKYFEKPSPGENKLFNPEQPSTQNRYQRLLNPGTKGVPATKHRLGRDPITNEFILLDEILAASPTRTGLELKHPKLFPTGGKHIIITNKRLILRDLANVFRSFEISKIELMFATITYKTISFLDDYELTIRLPNKKEYSIQLDFHTMLQVKQLIPDGKSYL